MTVMQAALGFAGRLLRPSRAGASKLALHRLGAPASRIEMRSASFPDGGTIPEPFTGRHGRSPALSWSAPPGETRELALLCEDPDIPIMRQPFVHWLVYGIPPELRELPEGLPPSELPLASGVQQGRTSTGRAGYIGPMPPPGHGPHHYHFQIFALDRRLDLQTPLERDQLIEAMRGHVIAAGEQIGIVER
jgi:Raf kinase inhibitor-like YbhB/YbcL family protein